MPIAEAQKETAPAEPAAPLLDARESEESPLTQMKQVTFAGKRNSDSVFSPDNKTLVFQSSRLFHDLREQIYRINLISGVTDLLSNPQFTAIHPALHPKQPRLLFAAHKSSLPETRLREGYELFELPMTGDSAKTRANALTSAVGFDGEPTFSPDGEWIAFVSRRHVFERVLNTSDQEPEIYIMRSNGTQIKRLTFSSGRDSRPQFSPDGRRLIWSHTSANQDLSEIMMMNTDGSDPRSVTRLKARSHEPAYHPSGDYIVFSSNKTGQFELYIVDAESNASGKSEAQQITAGAGSKRFPQFSSDGQKLTWTQESEHESQIYIGRWNDVRAREKIKLSPAVLKHNSLLGQFSPEDARKLIEYLASDELAGRMSSSSQEEVYQLHLSELFGDMGFEPAGSQGFLQPFDYTFAGKLGPEQKFLLRRAESTFQFSPSSDFLPLSFSSSGEFGEANLVFVGYGIEAPGSESQSAYDSYQGLDVKNRWVIAFRDVPENVAPERRVFLSQFAQAQHKAQVARERGARGLLLIRTSPIVDQTKLRFEGGSFGGKGLAVLDVSETVASELLRPLGKTLSDLKFAHASAANTSPTEVPGTRVSAKIDLIQEKATGYNLLALWRTPGADSTIVVGAHGDHLGRGQTGTSQALGSEAHRIHYGADDNASGVSALILIGKDWTARVREGTFKPKQNLMLAIWSGNEIGQLGSRDFVKRNEMKLGGYIDIDTVGRLRQAVYVQGSGSAKEWPFIFEKLAPTFDGNIELSESSNRASDLAPFYSAQIPALRFTSGSHVDLHTPRDQPSALNAIGIAQIAKLVAATVQTVTAQRGGLNFQKQPAESIRPSSQRIFLGTIPDHSQDGVIGVRITGTAKDSPAARAGLLPGDVIIGVGAAKVQSLFDYVNALKDLKANAPIALKLRRNERLEEKIITPTLRE